MYCGALLSLYTALLNVCEALLCVYRGSGRRHLSMMTQILHIRPLGSVYIRVRVASTFGLYLLFILCGGYG